MGGIFLSYRREDSAGWTGRLAEQLKTRFGWESIFMDIDTIEPGTDFTEALQQAVSSCDALLAMIGPEWATATDKSGKPRLEDPHDWVRVEISAALKRNIRVIPVLVGGASVPTKELLPDELDPLAHRQAHELTDKRWNYLEL
ncbi:MAG: toll/interleukin-1 receptor domain-containing protein [Nitrospira sp.]